MQDGQAFRTRHPKVLSASGKVSMETPGQRTLSGANGAVVLGAVTRPAQLPGQLPGHPIASRDRDDAGVGSPLSPCHLTVTVW